VLTKKLAVTDYAAKQSCRRLAYDLQKSKVDFTERENSFGRDTFLKSPGGADV